MKFEDLRTGDVLTLADRTAVIIAIEKPHPENPKFWLFVWYIFEENRFSFDMLDPEYSLIPGSRVTRDGLVSFKRAIRQGGKA